MSSGSCQGFRGWSTLPFEMLDAFRYKILAIRTLRSATQNTDSTGFLRLSDYPVKNYLRLTYNGNFARTSTAVRFNQ
jgi:hypothetical protein